MKKVISILIVFILTIATASLSAYAQNFESEDTLAESGAVYYNLWVGATHVSSENKDNILNDGGKAKFNPATNTLTLNDPSIFGVYYDGAYNNVIFAQNMDLTVKGTFHMSSYDAECGIKVKTAV